MARPRKVQLETAQQETQEELSTVIEDAPIGAATETLTNESESVGEYEELDVNIKDDESPDETAQNLFKNTSANRYDFKIVQFESGEVKELTETELNDSRIKYAIELGILEAQ